MGSKARRPGQTSELVAATMDSAPAMLAALVAQLGGRVLISFDALAQVADQVNMTVATTAEGMLLQTHLKPIIRPQLEVPEGPAGLPDLGVSSENIQQPAATADDYDGWDYPGSDGEGIDATPEDERLHVEGRLDEVFREHDPDPPCGFCRVARHEDCLMPNGEHCCCDDLEG